MSERPSFVARLAAAWRRNDSLVCVGLDPEPERFPAAVAGESQPIFAFNKAIVDATADLVCAYKPQFAHYAAHGAEEQLHRTIEYIQRTHPHVPVILDSKLKREDKGVIVLCRTSNPGARDVQDLEIGGRRLYHAIAELAAAKWNSRGNCMLVVGATYPRELAEVRQIVGEMPLLVPGVGAQGGDVAQAVSNGQTASGAGLMISSSRAILYASSSPDFAEAARKAAATLREQINASRARA